MFLLIYTGTAEQNTELVDFNTSHVSINLRLNTSGGGEVANFNTSHVSINPGGKAGDQTAREDFNTSHVSINRIFSTRLNAV